MGVTFKDRVKTSPGSAGDDGPGYSGGLYEVDRLLNDQATSSSAATVVTSFDDQPTIPAIIVFTPGGTTGDIAAGDIVIAGTDFEGSAQTEDVAITEDISSAVQTVAAYATVTSVTFPQADGSSATWDVGQAADMLFQWRVPDGHGVLFYEVVVHWPTPPTTAEDLLISVDADAGSNFDAVLNTTAYAADGSVLGTHWIPSSPIYLVKDDILTMTFDNTDQGLFGIQLITGLLE